VAEYKQGGGDLIAGVPVEGVTIFDARYRDRTLKL
jgi:hypothetical protein